MQLSYVREGSGTPLVLIHGLGSAATAWRTITPALAKEFDVIAFDLPGHGQTKFRDSIPMDPHSLAEQVISNLDSLGITNFDLVGNSLGGWIAFEIAATYPERVKSVTALAPAGLWPHPFTKINKRTTLIHFLAVLTVPIQPILLKQTWSKGIAFGRTSPRWVSLPYEVCLDAAQAMGRSPGYFPAWEATLNHRFESPVDPRIPVTVVFGDSDNTLPAATCQARDLAPAHSKWVIFKQTGHAPMWDEPGLVVDLVRATAK